MDNPVILGNIVLLAAVRKAFAVAEKAQCVYLAAFVSKLFDQINLFTLIRVINDETSAQAVIRPVSLFIFKLY